MSVETTRDVMTRFFNAAHGDVSMLADDVIFKLMATGQESATPQGVSEMFQYLYHVAFDAVATANVMVFGDDHAVCEFDFHGKHIGEFAGVPATGKEVHVPLCVVYDLEKGKIKAARIYFEIPALMAQLGVAMG